MEKDLYRDEFEQMLKDTSEEFRMYPSRKVWHSIYNDFHPDRKWPSLTVCLVLVTSILYVGISNNNTISKNSKNLLVSTNPADNSSFIETNKGTRFSSPESANLAANANKKFLNKTNSTTVINLLDNVFEDEDNTTLDKENNLPLSDSKQKSASLNQEKENPYFLINVLADNLQKEDTSKENLILDLLKPSLPIDAGNLNVQDLDLSTVKESHTDLNNSPNLEKAKIVNITQAQEIVTFNTETSDFLSGNQIANNKLNNESLESIVSYTKTISLDEKEWLEDFAFHNKKNRDKWKSHLSVQYYITPSLGYRELFKNNDFVPANGGLLLRTSSTDIISQQAAVNLETGAVLLFDLNKKLNFKTGIQFNLTNYVTNAHKLQHPSQTTVLMNDLNNNTIMPVAYNSFHGNVLGSNLNSLNNKTYQVSIPIGLNYKLMGTDKVKWYVGGTVQPTFITGGNVYLISADNKNFVQDPSMLRTWNMNSSLETFASINTASGININIGPQFRYQLLSSYSKRYTYTEKLYNVGIKLGMTKKL